MEGSIEMKMQAIDKMIELRSQLITMQENLGMYNGFEERTSILIYKTDVFFEYASHIGTKVTSVYVTDDGDICVMFTYKDVMFDTYVKPEEYQMYEHEIYKGDENVL